MGKYDDIINLPHHESDFHPRMPMENRAAQFAPFAALAGHDDAIEETIRVTGRIKELADEEKIEISKKLREAWENKLEVKIKHFIPDKKKKGGQYIQTHGKIKKIIEEEKYIILNSGENISVDNISDIYSPEDHNNKLQ